MDKFLGQIKNCYAFLPDILKTLTNIANAEQHLDPLTNQIAQRDIVKNVRFKNSAFDELPGFKSKLLLKIDCYITQLIDLLIKDVDEFEEKLVTFKGMYDDVGQTIQNSSNLFYTEDFLVATENHSSINDLLSCLDEIIILLYEDLLKKRELIERFNTMSSKSVEQVCRRWKLPRIITEKIRYAIFVGNSIIL